MIANARRRLAERGDEGIVDKEALRQRPQMRIAQLEQMIPQSIVHLLDVLLGARHKFLERDLAGFDALELREQHLQRALKKLYFSLDAQEIAFVERAKLWLIGVPEP